MITHLFGVLEHVDSDRITVDVDGVGYLVYVPARVMSSLPPVSEKIKVHTYLHVREDAMTLYGFPTKEERHLFTMLLGVSGIGPKGALALLSLELPKLVAAIAQSKVDLITSIPGIGLKTAQRIIIELKEKVSRAYAVSPADTLTGLPVETPLVKDALSALVTLGYRPREARQAMTGVDLSQVNSVEEAIKLALKNLS